MGENSGVGSSTNTTTPTTGETTNLNKINADQTTSRLADYFVICGLDLDTGLEPDRFAGKKFLFSTGKQYFTNTNKPI